MSDLPDGWIETTLGSIVDYGKVDRAEPNELPTDGWILELEDIEKDTSKLLQRLSFADRDSKSTKNKFKKGDVLYGKLRPYLNKILIADQDGFCTTEIVPIKPNEAINNRFLFYWLKHPAFLNYVNTVSYGLNMPRLGTKDGLAAPLILAPLDEQTRIADKLDTLLARVDSCQAHLSRVPQLLKSFRQSVLAAAMSGRLTEGWREENSRELSKWTQVPVGSLITDIEAGINVKCDERPPLEHERGLVKISAVTWGTYNDNESKTLPISHPVPEYTRIKIGDFLISRANTIELVGACVIVEQVNRPVYLSDKILRLVMDNDIKKWMLFWLRSEAGRTQIESLSSGNQLSMRNISQANLRTIQVNLPLPDERVEIVRRVEALFALADRLEARWRAAQGRVAGLTPSLLAKAFRGELVPQDTDDEPVDVLLERIRTARELASKAPIERKSTDKKDRINKIEVSMLKRNEIKENHLSAILKERGALTAEGLWYASKLEIDEFYDQLKDEEAKNMLREISPEDPNAPRLLESL